MPVANFVPRASAVKAHGFPFPPRAADHFGNQLQITVYLCRLNDSNPVCPNPVTEAQKPHNSLAP